ncbi:hypothetical protein PAXINDRAFT_101861, partial [Paxillus involutus ATCC 200175]
MVQSATNTATETKYTASIYVPHHPVVRSLWRAIWRWLRALITSHVSPTTATERTSEDILGIAGKMTPGYGHFHVYFSRHLYHPSTASLRLHHLHPNGQYTRLAVNTHLTTSADQSSFSRRNTVERPSTSWSGGYQVTTEFRVTSKPTKKRRKQQKGPATTALEVVYLYSYAKPYCPVASPLSSKTIKHSQRPGGKSYGGNPLASRWPRITKRRNPHLTS